MFARYVIRKVSGVRGGSLVMSRIEKGGKKRSR